MLYMISENIFIFQSIHVFGRIFIAILAHTVRDEGDDDP